ncbi:ParB/RepB/Spo0J family partition protein [Candidatus Marinimicrobia bacterium MT.SAG.4]|nr:ParB/RepB/Spo0J family partition protein [Candidatus Marinimicrobia bacterium MT.SAG.4]
MPAKSLGRGIGALIPEIDEPSDSKPEVAELLVDSISSNPHQPRHDFDPVALEELAASINENGIVQPITVRKKEGKFELIAGERRLRAVKLINMRTIPAYVMSVENDGSLLQLALIENIQREDLNPVDVALAYRELVETHGLTHGEIADRVGKDRSTVANFLRLLGLPDEIKESVRKGEISQGHARALLPIQESAKMLALYRKIIKDGLSVRQVEDIIKGGIKETPKRIRIKTSSAKSPQLKAIESELMMKFGTKVRIKEKGSGGEVIVEYYSNEDLDRLITLIGQLDS